MVQGQVNQDARGCGVNAEQAIDYIKSLPPDVGDGIVVILPRKRKAQRTDKDRTFRVPQQCAEAFEEMLSHVAARLGSQAREVQIDFIISIVQHTLEGE